MSDIRFYHLTSQTLDQALPALLSKALEGGHRVLVRGADEVEIERLNTHLWAYDASSFLPHGSLKDGKETDQPVFLSFEEGNPNLANVLILIQGVEAPDVSEFSMVCEMLDGRNNDAVAGARVRWGAYKEAGHDLTYWQQSPQGAWEKKAS